MPGRATARSSRSRWPSTASGRTRRSARPPPGSPGAVDHLIGTPRRGSMSSPAGRATLPGTSSRSIRIGTTRGWATTSCSASPSPSAEAPQPRTAAALSTCRKQSRSGGVDEARATTTPASSRARSVKFSRWSGVDFLPATMKLHVRYHRLRPVTTVLVRRRTTSGGFGWREEAGDRRRDGGGVVEPEHVTGSFDDPELAAW